jgi:hypothetical protein
VFIDLTPQETIHIAMYVAGLMICIIYSFPDGKDL